MKGIPHIILMHQDKIEEINHIIELIVKHHNKVLTVPEKKELEQWINRSTPNKQLFEELESEAYRKIALDQIDGYNEDRALQRVKERIGMYATIASKRSNNKRWRRLGVAATIAVFLGSMLFVSLFPLKKADVKDKTAIVQLKDDVSPGGNKAVLTLANGKSIVLNNAQVGQLAHQGNSKVMKINSGLLSYSSQETRAGGSQQKEVVYNTLTTPRGGQYQLVLPDGTKVWLNAASSIRFPTAFVGKARVVEITGEAYFEVEPLTPLTDGEQMKPFIVQVSSSSGNMDVKVLGTHFNVNAYKGEPAVEVTLLEGSVRVSQLTAHHSQVIKPGEQVQVNKTGNIKLIKNADVNQAVAWKEGRFEFNGNIQGIMREIARWYDVEVVYEGNVTDKAFGGTISRYKKVSKVLNILELTGSIHFKIEKNAEQGYKGKIIVKP